jgi:hypothetical protein
MPIAAAMNWVGGAQTPQVAGDALATGGFAATLVNVAGTVQFVDVERVWVRAFVDFIPSRGAVQVQGDTWVDLDPAFKQYAFGAPLPVANAVPLDINQIISHATATATVDTTLGSIANLDLNAATNDLNAYAGNVQMYLTGANPQYQISDVVGTKTIIPDAPPVLAGTLPFPTIATVGEFSQVPTSLVHSLTLTVGNDFGDDFSVSFRLAELAEKNVFLAYRPATQADTDALRAYLPSDPNAPASAYPTSLPANVADFVAELIVDGTVVATGPPNGLGNRETFTMRFDAPDGPKSFVNDVTVGEYYAIGLDLARIGGLRNDHLDAEMQGVKDAFSHGLAATLTREQAIGSMLTATMLQWFRNDDRVSEHAARSANLIHVRLPSSGLFFSQLDVETLFGIPVTVHAGGVTMDVDNNAGFTLARDGDQTRTVQANYLAGQMSSANEALLPQVNYTTADGPAQSVSTMIALKLANEQGIPIFQIDASNAATAIPQLTIGASNIAIVQDSIAHGMTVTVPRDPVLFAGQHVVGLMVLDPATGSGAYLIGGVSGGLTKLLTDPLAIIFVGALGLLAGIFGWVGVAIAAAVVGVIQAVLGFIETMNRIRDSQCLDTNTQNAFIALDALFPIIGIGLIASGFIPGLSILAAFVAVSMIVMIYAILFDAAIQAAARVADQIACRNNQLQDPLGQPP